MTTQLQHQQAAAQNREQFASVNHGRLSGVKRSFWSTTFIFPDAS
jgi:hypothetical protein